MTGSERPRSLSPGKHQHGNQPWSLRIGQIKVVPSTPGSTGRHELVQSTHWTGPRGRMATTLQTGAKSQQSWAIPPRNGRLSRSRRYQPLTMTMSQRESRNRITTRTFSTRLRLHEKVFWGHSQPMDVTTMTPPHCDPADLASTWSRAAALDGGHYVSCCWH